MALPTIFTRDGLLPQSPASLRAQLLASVAADRPGYTATLPGSLIEDISSTDVGALVVCDSARVELVNSLTPYGANAFLLAELGEQFGVSIGGATNTSVFLVFTGPNGYVVSPGFTVSDGTYQYVVRDGGIVGSGLETAPLFAVATVQGMWSVPAGTVNQIVTSVPSPIALTVTNPSPGTPGLPTGESEESYRARVLDAQLAVSQGATRYLKTLLGNIEGVQRRLISVRQVTGGWEVICGGGDPYSVADAIFRSLFDLSDLVGSTINVTGATKAAAAVITTDLSHGFTTGQDDVVIAGATGMTGINGTWTVTVISPTSFSIPYNSTGAPDYTGDGVVTPNDRNIVVSISDPPDTYLIPYVDPPEQEVTINLLWNTSSPNFVSDAAVAQLGAPALAAYVNSIFAGQPMNLFELQSTFREAIRSVLAPPLLTRMVFTVNIDGVAVPPDAGTGIIEGDPESYFLTTAAAITIARG